MRVNASGGNNDAITSRLILASITPRGVGFVLRAVILLCSDFRLLSSSSVMTFHWKSLLIEWELPQEVIDSLTGKLLKPCMCDRP